MSWVFTRKRLLSQFLQRFLPALQDFTGVVQLKLYGRCNIRILRNILPILLYSILFI